MRKVGAVFHKEGEVDDANFSEEKEDEEEKWLTVKMIVRTLSSKPDVRTASWCAFGAPASSERTKRVPIQTALAPNISAAASD